MFTKILVALDHSSADASLLPPVKELARLMHSQILLLHVSTGWAARWQRNLDLSDSQEMQEDRAYLDQLQGQLAAEGYTVSTQHSFGEPSEEILRAALLQRCDLIAMTTHGHRWLSDLIYGNTIDKVRHETAIPIFVVRAARE